MPKEQTKTARYWASELWELGYLKHKRFIKKWFKRKLSKARRKAPIEVE